MPLLLFFVPYSNFPVCFLSLLFLLFLPFCLFPFLLLVFCSSAKPLLNPRTIRGFSYTKTHGAENILPRVPIYVNSYVLKIVSYPRFVNGPKNFRGGTPRLAVPIQRRAFLPNFRRLRFSAILPRRCYTSTRSSNCPPFQTQCL